MKVRTHWSEILKFNILAKVSFLVPIKRLTAVLKSQKCQFLIQIDFPVYVLKESREILHSHYELNAFVNQEIDKKNTEYITKLIKLCML